jgi:hypothetical protein
MSEARSQNSKSTRETNQAAQAVASAAERGTEAAGQSGRAGAEALRRSAETATEAGRKIGESGAETLRRSAEAIAGSQRQITEEAAERLQEVSRTMAETARGTAEDMRALMSLPTVADRGLQDLHHSFSGLVEGVVQANLRATEELVRLTHPAAFVDLQQRFVRDYMNAVMEGSAAFVRAVRQTTDQALPQLEQHLRQRRQSAQNTGGTYQAVAE